MKQDYKITRIGDTLTFQVEHPDFKGKVICVRKSSNSQEWTDIIICLTHSFVFAGWFWYLFLFGGES